MLEFLRIHQLNIMLCMSSICGIIVFFILITKSMAWRRKIALMLTEAGGMLLLIFDRYACLYRGNESVTGWWMVRISNFMVFFMSYATIFFFNHYQRSPAYPISVAIPLVVLVIQLSAIIQYGRNLRRRMRIPLLLFTIVPLLAGVLQILFYGVSLANMSIVGTEIIMYVYVVLDMNDAEEAKEEAGKRDDVDYIKAAAGDMSCDGLEAVFNKMEGYRIPEGYRDLYNNLKTAADNYDYEKILSLGP